MVVLKEGEVMSETPVINDHELVISRIFDAPRLLVWQAWTDPKHLIQWWGPNGFSNTAFEMDFRVGGCFHLNLCAPDGTIYPCQGIYREITAPERIVYTSTADEKHPCGAGLPPRSVVTITFNELGNQTELIVHTRFETASRCEAANQAGYHKGWTESLGRLQSNIDVQQ